MDTLERAIARLRRGEPVLLYDADGREEETDMVLASQFATSDKVRLLRKDAGGLLCTTIAPEHHRKLGLPFLADMTQALGGRYPVLRTLIADDVRYDPSKSSFGITINHRGTYTGIPDDDRSLTIRELASLLGQVDALEPVRARSRFGEAFRSPGHVILLNGADGGLAKRQGHTELSLELARLSSLVPSTTICEMLDPDSGQALGKKAAAAYAERHGLVFLTGQDVLTAWQTRVAHPEAAQAVA